MGDSRRAWAAATDAAVAPVLPTVTAAEDMGKAGEGGRRMYLRVSKGRNMGYIDGGSKQD